MKDGKTPEESIYDAGKTWVADGNSIDDIVQYKVQVNPQRSNLDTWLALRECQPLGLNVYRDCIPLDTKKDACSYSFHLLKECLSQVTNPKEKQDLENCMEKGLLDVVKTMSPLSKEEFLNKGIDHWNAVLRNHQDCSTEREELRVKSLESWNSIFPPPAKQKYELIKRTMKHCYKYASALDTCNLNKTEDCTPIVHQLLACSASNLKISGGTELAKCLSDAKSPCNHEYNNARAALEQYKYGFVKDLGIPDSLNGFQKNEVLKIMAQILDPVMTGLLRLKDWDLKTFRELYNKKKKLKRRMKRRRKLIS